jgi:Flp pilus assembly pilin Flp
VLNLYVFMQTLLARWVVTWFDRDERGQATAEYALVLLGAAGVALLVMAWANDSDRVTRLLNKVFDHLLGRVQ